MYRRDLWTSVCFVLYKMHNKSTKCAMNRALDLAKIEYYCDFAEYVGYLVCCSWYIVYMDIWKKPEHFNLLQHPCIARYYGAIVSWRLRLIWRSIVFVSDRHVMRYATRPQSRDSTSLELLKVRCLTWINFVSTLTSTTAIDLIAMYCCYLCRQSNRTIW